MDNHLLKVDNEKSITREATIESNLKANVITNSKVDVKIDITNIKEFYFIDVLNEKTYVLDINKLVKLGILKENRKK